MGTVTRTGRRYEETHPWITFRLDLKSCSPHFWMLLGEARSKCDHMRYVPLEAGTARELMRIYLAKGVQATTAIEGNTLTEDQVLERIDEQLELPVSQEYLAREIDNMVDAYNDIVAKAMAGEELRLDRQTLCDLNKAILDGTNHEPNAVPGQIRQHAVTAGPNYVAPPWPDCEYLVDRMCEWLNGPTFEPPAESDRIPYAFLKAVAAHVYIEWIHPFGDGNGRLGRLAEFIVLVAGGVPIPAAHILTSHYNETRSEYYRQLNDASRHNNGKGDVGPFLHYAAQGWMDGLTAAIKRLHRQQEKLMWQALVDREADGTSPAAHRRRMLAHNLGRVDEWLSRAALRDIDPQLAMAYADRTAKTMTRDLNVLLSKGLIQTRGNKVRADMSVVRGMRPFACGGAKGSNGDDGAERHRRRHGTTPPRH